MNDCETETERGITFFRFALPKSPYQIPAMTL